MPTDVLSCPFQTSMPNNTAVPALGNGNPGIRNSSIVSDEQGRCYLFVQFGVANIQPGDPCFLLRDPISGQFYATNVFSSTYAQRCFAGIAIWGTSPPNRQPLQFDYAWIQSQGPNIVPMSSAGAVIINHNVYPFAQGIVADTLDVTINVANPIGFCGAAIAGAGTLNIPAGAVFINTGISR